MILLDVIGDFLAELSERELYLPFFGLLLAEGFTDVRFTHGGAEFGKDFLAKRMSSEGAWEQWCFQVKAGDINQGAWRNEIQGQLLEAATSGLGHPGFDTAMPRRVALVTSGRLVGQAPIAFQSFNESFLPRFGVQPVEVWDIQRLKRAFADKAMTSLVSKSRQLLTLGQLLQTYGKALEGELSADDVEHYSRAWIGSETGNAEAHALFIATFEAALLADAFHRHRRSYEEAHCYLALIRAAMSFELSAQGDDRVRTILMFARGSLLRVCNELLTSVAAPWRSQGRNLVRTYPLAAGGPAHYLAQCARIAECAALAMFLGNSDDRAFAAAFLKEWIENEPGVTHPLSDKYAVSIVWSLLGLWVMGEAATIHNALRTVIVWICDRYEDDACLASVGSSALEEVRTVFGDSFEFAEIPRRRQSLLGCALGDLAAFVGDKALYADAINDMKAVEICPEYVQTGDSPEQFTVDGSRLQHYVNVVFNDALESGDPYYADHVQHEPASFSVADSLGPEWYVALSILLRDRYFPSLWKRLLDVHP